jgi:thioredoxin 1
VRIGSAFCLGSEHPPTDIVGSALESALKRHASASTSTFSGKGQTLGGSSSSQPKVAAKSAAPVPRTVAPTAGGFGSGLDSNFQTLLLLIAAYGFFILLC